VFDFFPSPPPLHPFLNVHNIVDLQDPLMDEYMKGKSN